MIFLHGGMPCVAEVAAAAPALPFLVTLYYAFMHHLKERKNPKADCDE